MKKMTSLNGESSDDFTIQLPKFGTPAVHGNKISKIPIPSRGLLCLNARNDCGVLIPWDLIDELAMEHEPKLRIDSIPK